MQPSLKTAKNQLTTDLKTMDPNHDPIPEEILFDILTRLPVKSLCRFRCVSKLWFSSISDPDFVAAHLASSRSRPKLLISVLSGDPQPKIHTCTFFSIDYPQQDMSEQPLRAASNSSIDFAYAYMISQSPSGLICFTCSEGTKIGNPITGDYDLIPFPVSHFYREKSFFGFDPIGKTHVILKLERHDFSPGSSCGKSRVFDLVENRWYDTSPHPWICGGDSSVCIDGVIYFIAWADMPSFRSLGECLYAYDVRLKRFQLIQRPPNSDGRLFVVELLIEYKGRLALVGDGNLHDSSVDEIRLWILEDLDKHIWRFKSFVVPWRENLMRDEIISDEHRYLVGRKVKLFGVTHRDELILATPLSRGSLHLFFYEIETSMLRRFKVDGFNRYGELRFNLVVESLQSPKGFDKKKEEKCPLQLLPAFTNVHSPPLQFTPTSLTFSLKNKSNFGFDLIDKNHVLCGYAPGE